MQEAAIIILSSDDWGWKTSKYQLSTRFAQDNRVLFVSSIGFRALSATKRDLSRIYNKLVNFLEGVKNITPSLYVLTPLIIPFRKNFLVTLANTIILKFQLYCSMRALAMKEPYLFVFSQNWLQAVKKLPRKKLIYYCVDEHSGFKGIDQELFRQNDREMAEMADIVICSSYKLYLQKKEINKHSYYISHGVNHELFSRAVHDDTLAIPLDVSGLTPPVIGFIGHISYDWVDESLLKFVAAARPGWTILLIGRYSMNPDEFSAFGNIKILGERNYDELPAYCKVLNVALIPFVKSILTDNCNPLKMHEYLSAGLPVVSTDIPEVKRYAHMVHVVQSQEEFLASCELALSEGHADMKKMRSLSMVQSSWDNKVKEIYGIIAKRMPAECISDMAV